jgi:hypothetical protein
MVYEFGEKVAGYYFLHQHLFLYPTICTVEGYHFVPHDGMLAVRIYIYIHDSQLLRTTYQHRVLRNRIWLMNVPSIYSCKGRVYIEYIALPVVMATHKGYRVYPVGIVQMPSVAGSIYTIIARSTCKHHDYR